MSILGNKIRLARKEKGLTQKQLSDGNISRRMISLLENNLINPPLEILKYIAIKLDKPLSYFLSESWSLGISYENFIIELEELLLAVQYEEIIQKVKEFTICYGNIEEHLLNNRSLGIYYTILGITYFYLDRALAPNYFYKAIETLDGTNSSIYICKCHHYMALINHSIKNYVAMQNHLLRANALITNVALDSIYLKINISYNLALAYFYQCEFAKAIELTSAVFNYCNKYDLYVGFGELNRLASHCYKYMNQLDDAILWTSNAINYYLLSNNTTLLHRCYINLCILYRAKKDQDNALYYIEKAIRYFEQTNNRPKLINSQIEKVITLFEFDSDPCFIKDLINVTIGLPDISNSSRGELLSVLGIIELRQKNYPKALELLSNSEALVINEAQSDMNIFIYNGLQEIYEIIGDSQNSALYKKKSDELLILKPYYNNFLPK